MTNAEIRNRLLNIAAELTQISAELSNEPIAIVDIAEDVAEKIAKRVCLVCGKKLKTAESSSRGCHSKCYQAIRRKIKAGKLSDSDAVKSGLLAPADSGGRPSGDLYEKAVAKAAEIENNIPIEANSKTAKKSRKAQ